MKSDIKKLLNDRVNLLVIGAMILILISGAALDFDNTVNPVDATAKNQNADTYIPAGHVLIPIQIANIESISGMMGHFGIVDLFRIPDGEGKSPKLIASRVRLIRAPLDPNQFAVLVREDEAPPILTGLGEIRAVIQNPNSLTGKVMKDSKVTSRLTIGSGESL